MDDFFAVAKDDQGVEKRKPCRYDNEHVDGGGIMHVILQERAPGRQGPGPPWKILPTVARLTSMSLEQPQDAGALKRVCQAHLRTSSRISRFILAAPEARSTPPPAARSVKPHPEQPVGGEEPRAWALRLRTVTGWRRAMSSSSREAATAKRE